MSWEGPIVTTQGGNEERCPTCLYEGGTYAGAQAFCRDPWHTTEQPAGDAAVDDAVFDAGWEAGQVDARKELLPRITSLEAQLREARRFEHAHTGMDGTEHLDRASLEAEVAALRLVIEAHGVVMGRKLARIEQLERNWAASIDAKEHMREHIKRLDKALRTNRGHAMGCQIGARRPCDCYLSALSPDPTTPEGR